MRQRIREAVVCIAKTDLKHVNALPILERSLLPILSCASVVYRAASFVRRVLYSYGFLNPTRLQVPVVSVGNITWGGNGKTPMVEFLSGCFLGAGVSPLILTRGYAGGDEAQLLQRHLQGSSAKVGVGPDRAKVAQSLLQQYGIMSPLHRKERAEFLQIWNENKLSDSWQKGDGKVGVVILDDGMQHLRLVRDLEIVMVNLITLWGNQNMVPLGPLRESFHGLRRADVVVLHHADLVSEERIASVRDMLEQLLRDECVVICSRMMPRCLFKVPAVGVKAWKTQGRLDDAKLLVPLEALQGTVVLCVSGIGCPESLSLVCERLGSYYVERMDYLDHHKFQRRDLQDIQLKYVQLQEKFKDKTVVVVLTEKDYIRDVSIWRQVKGAELLILHSSLGLMSTGKSLEVFKGMLAGVASSSPHEYTQLGRFFWHQVLIFYS